MEIQREISAEINRNRIGKQFKVIIDREEGEYIVGRSQFDSPEVDTEVLISKAKANKITLGSFVTCKIIEADDYDLFGEVETP